MVEYFSEAYWNELASILNNDEDFRENASDLDTSMIFVADDKDLAYKLTFEGGKVEATESSQDEEADFKFIGPYEQWVRNHKGEADFQRLMMTGKIKFEGSMSQIMSLRKQLGSAMGKAAEIDAEY